MSKLTLVEYVEKHPHLETEIGGMIVELTNRCATNWDLFNHLILTEKMFEDVSTLSPNNRTAVYNLLSRTFYVSILCSLIWKLFQKPFQYFYKITGGPGVL